MHGYKDWARQNVALWISNDEGLYALAEDMLDQHGSIHKAADGILQALTEMGIVRTPDGAKFTRARIVEALRKW